MAMSERRKHKRFSFIEDVIVDGSKRCTSSDISEGGIYISAIQAFEEGAVMDVTIPFGKGQLKVKGEVRHFQHGIGMGIMFVDLSDEQKEQIHEIVGTLAKGTS